ncbi:conserved hypothetical protein [delta proteobacterium NaphS2]|nr:conserved hypothetical protein [delta proteobacterium NaphS2]
MTVATGYPVFTGSTGRSSGRKGARFSAEMRLMKNEIVGQ